jgi:hypothetical protein
MGRCNEHARADQRVIRKYPGVGTFLAKKEEEVDFDMSSSCGHFSQPF